MTLTQLEKTAFGFLGALIVIGGILFGLKVQQHRSGNQTAEAEIRRIAALTPRTALAKVAAREDDSVPGVDKINVNTATAKDIDAIPGVGKTLAERIVEFRQSHGRIQDMNELLGVQGISPKKLETLNRYLTTASTAASLQAKKKLNLNFASQKEIEALPGIGPGLAKAIVEYRNRKGTFYSLEDLQEIPGLTEAKFLKFEEMVEVK